MSEPTQEIKTPIVADIVHYCFSAEGKCNAAVVTFVINPTCVSLTTFPPPGGVPVNTNVWYGLGEGQWHYPTDH